MYNKVVFLIIIAFLALTIVACSEKSVEYPKSIVLKTNLDSVTYVIGMNLGKNFLKDSLMIDIHILGTALNHAIYGGEMQLTEEQANEIMRSFQTELTTKQQEKMMEQGKVNQKKGDEFLAENKNKPNIKTTESGLQYEVIKEGSGKSPKAEETVKVNYKGTTLDGNVFDSTKEGDPAEFPLNRVIKGWTEGIQLMKEGAQFRFFIPSELAYGLRGAPPQIGPSETLIFEVELLEVIGSK